jgi:hypothetical protein
MVSRHREATEYVDDVLRCYRRIHMSLGRLTVSYDLLVALREGRLMGVADECKLGRVESRKWAKDGAWLVTKKSPLLGG